ncbi:MAG: Rossmann-like domain-containing protein [Promethearchaeota archaeon]
MNHFIRDVLNKIYNEPEKFLRLRVKDLVVGISYTAILLENDVLGVISTNPEFLYSECCLFDGSNLIGNFLNCDLGELIDQTISKHKINRLIGYVAINAFSQALLSDRNNMMDLGKRSPDITEILEDYKDEPIFMIGEIRPIIKTLNQKNFTVFVKDFKKKKSFDLDVEKLKRDKHGILIISGSSISNETLIKELEDYRFVKKIVLIGPSAQIYPPYIFTLTNIDVIASMWFKEPVKAFETIKQGGGTPYFQKYAIKYCISRVN